HLVAIGADLAKICMPWTGTLDHFKGMTSEPQMPLPLERVVWAGQAVVAVVAESRALAEDALELITIEYEELPAVVDVDAARRPGAPLVNHGRSSNLCFRSQLDSGGVEDAFARA